MAQQFIVETRPDGPESDILSWVRDVQTTSVNKPGHHRREEFVPDKPYTPRIVGTVFGSYSEAEMWIYPAAP